MRILGVGLLVCDILVKPVSAAVLAADTYMAEKIHISVGGDAFNVVSNLNRMGQEALFVGGIGQDEFADIIRGIMKKRGLSTEGLLEDDVRSSVTAVLIHEDGERSFLGQEGACQWLDASRVPDAWLHEGDLLFVGSAGALPTMEDNGSLEDLMKRAHAAGMTVAMDVSGTREAMTSQRLEPLIRQADLFFPSLQEASLLCGSEDPKKIAEYYHGLGIRTLAVKMGEKGSYLSCDTYEGMIAAYPAQAIDTTGAGDSFVSGFLYGYVNGYSMKECAMLGSAAGSLCVQTVGASEADLSVERLQKVIRQRTE